MDLPEHFGSWTGVHNRLRVWAADGTWAEVFTALVAQADAEGDLAWVVSVDSTIVRARQHTAGPVKRGPGRRACRSCGSLYASRGRGGAPHVRPFSSPG